MAKEKKEITASEEETETKSEKKEKKSKKDDSAVSDKKSGKKGSDKKSAKKEQGKVGKWFHDLKVEFKKVVWPTKKTVLNNTSVVLGVVVGSAVLVGLLDEGFLALLRLIYQ